MADYLEKEESDDSEKTSDEKIKSDYDLLVKLDNMFTYALDHPTWIAARQEMIKCNEYNEGKQWTSDELSELEDRHQPASVSNLVSVTVNKLVGELVNQKVRIGFRGRNGEVDNQSAQDASDLFLYIRQSNDLEFEERDMAKDGFVGGFGVLDVYPTFDDLYQPEIKVAHEDCLAVFPDPDSKRYDWNDDAKFICRAKWMDADEAGEKYPQAKSTITDLIEGAGLTAIAGGQLSQVETFRGENYVDQKRKRVRLIEVQYKKYERECIYLFANGEIRQEAEATSAVLKEATAAGIAFEKIDRIKPKLCFSLYVAGKVIDHKVTSRKYFGLVPYFVYRKKDGAPYSLITLALSVQDAINKRESKALHLLNTNQTVAERGALKEKDLYSEEIAKPDGVAIVEDGALSQQKLLLRNNLEMAVGQQQMHTSAVNMFYSITGINPNIYGNTGEIRSGSGLKTKFAEANKPVAAIFDNLKRTRKILGRVLLDMIHIYFTKEKVMLVTDDPKAAQRAVTLTSERLDRLKQMQYDVVVDDFEDTATVQQEQWALFMQYLPNILPYGPFWIEKVLGMSDLRDKDLLIKELKASGQPPPLAPRISFQANLDNLPANERAFMYQLMGNPQLAAQVADAQEPSTVDKKAHIEITKMQTDAGIEHEKTRTQAAVSLATARTAALAKGRKDENT